MLKAAVHAALTRLVALLKSRGAAVRVIYLDPKPDGRKVGLDDFFVAGGTMARLLERATDTLKSGPARETMRKFPYRETATDFVYDKPVGNGTVPVELSNFTARITNDVIEDDGLEQRRLYEVEVKLGGRRATARVVPDRFASMNWVAEALGSRGIVAPGATIRDHLRAAIQLFSHETTERRVYTHTGWRKENGVWVYLHAGGALGAQGPIDGIEVALPSNLQRYVLNPSTEGIGDAIRASLRMLDVAPLAVTVPVFGAVYRAVLGSADFSIYLSGESGKGKSEITALGQAHYGATMDARHFAANWASTENVLEGIAFTAKDAVLVIDDFCPQGSVTDIQQYHKKADRVLRGQANAAGRLRMRADATLRPERPPRGLIISSGEDIPKGQSLRSRLLVSEVAPNAMNWTKLTACQQDAARGRYAQSLGSYVRWLAAQYEEVQATLNQQRRELRDRAALEGHKRTPGIIADLGLGLRYFLRFGVQLGALPQREADHLWSEWWNTLLAIGEEQGQHQASQEPTQRFLSLVRGALISGRTYLAAPDGGAPKQAEAYGWQHHVIGIGEYMREEWRPRGEKVGWVEKENIYLEPEMVFAIVQGLSRAQNDTIPVTQRTLFKRMKEKGYLASTDAKRGTNTIRRVLEGSEHQVLHLSKDLLVGQGTVGNVGFVADEFPTADHPVMSVSVGLLPAVSARPPEQLHFPDNPTVSANPTSNPTLEYRDNSGSYNMNVGNVRKEEGIPVVAPLSSHNAPENTLGDEPQKAPPLAYETRQANPTLEPERRFDEEERAAIQADCELDPDDVTVVFVEEV